jgi:fibronectin-binding autotransporter adhesin
MAYKFQLGDAIMSGALTQEDGIIVDTGGLTVTAGGITATAGGVTITAGGLNLDAGGADLNASGLTNAGAVSGVTTLSGSGASTLFTLEVGGGVDDFTVSEVGAVSGSGATTMASASFTQIYAAGVVEFADELKVHDLVNSTLGYQVGNSTVIDSSRNVGNVGTLSASAAATLFNLDVGAGVDNFTVNKLGVLSSSASNTMASSSFAHLYSEGQSEFKGAILVHGDSEFYGEVDFDGDVTLGNHASDIILASGQLTSSIGLEIGGDGVCSNAIPDQDSLRDLGSSAKRWSTIYVDSIIGANTKLDVESVAGGGTITAGTDFALVTSGNGTAVTLPALGLTSAGTMIYVKLSSSVGDCILTANTNDRIQSSASIRLESTGSAVTLVAMDAIDWKIM